MNRRVNKLSKVISVSNNLLSSRDIDSFRVEVEKEMLKMGATSEELKLLHDEAIQNTIIRNGKPEDLAWALLQ